MCFGALRNIIQPLSRALISRTSSTCSMAQVPFSALSMTSKPESKSLFGRLVHRQSLWLPISSYFRSLINIRYSKRRLVDKLYRASLRPPENYLNQLHTKAIHHYSCRSDEEDDDPNSEKNKKQEENQRDRLYLYKSKGQHLLTNTRILDKIVAKSYVKPNDTVLEIGPGTGNLTLKLLEVAEKVIAVEVDKRMVEVLNKRVGEHGFEDRLTVICKDAMKTEFPPFDLVVANIPYGISSPLVAKLVFGTNLFRSATLLLQKEFSRRLMAEPGDPEFNRLAVNVKLLAEVEFVMDVSKREFVPPPKVDSSVVIIRPKPKISNLNLDEWCAFTRTCFSKKNKTLGATLKQKKKVAELMRLSKRIVKGGSERDERLFKERIVEVLETSGFEDKRPSKMCHEEFLHLLSLFNQAGVYFHDHAKPKDVQDYASILATYNS